MSDSLLDILDRDIRLVSAVTQTRSIGSLQSTLMKSLMRSILKRLHLASVRESGWDGLLVPDLCQTKSKTREDKPRQDRRE